MMTNIASDQPYIKYTDSNHQPKCIQMLNSTKFRDWDKLGISDKDFLGAITRRGLLNCTLGYPNEKNYLKKLKFCYGLKLKTIKALIAHNLIFRNKLDHHSLPVRKEFLDKLDAKLEHPSQIAILSDSKDLFNEATYPLLVYSLALGFQTLCHPERIVTTQVEKASEGLDEFSIRMNANYRAANQSLINQAYETRRQALLEERKTELAYLSKIKTITGVDFRNLKEDTFGTHSPNLIVGRSLLCHCQPETPDRVCSGLRSSELAQMFEQLEKLLSLESGSKIIFDSGDEENHLIQEFVELSHLLAKKLSGKVKVTLMLRVAEGQDMRIENANGVWGIKLKRL